MPINNIPYSVNLGGSHTTDPNGEAWTPAKVQNLQIGVKSTVPAGGTVAIRSMAVQVKVAAIPVVKSIFFSPNANLDFDFDINNYVNWEYYDPNKSPQTFWEVKVYDNATVVQSGFSANTTTPLWTSSGNNTASGVELLRTTGYQDGEQYWAFIRVGKKHNNQTVYSKWNSAQFTATIAQPQPPMISVLKDESTAVNKLVIQTSDNLLSANNADFASSIGAWNKTAADTANPTLLVGATATTTGETLAATTVISSLKVGTVGTLASAIASSGLGTFKVTGTTNPSGTSHIAFTGTLTSGSDTITLAAPVTGLIAGMVVFGVGIPSGAVIESVTGAPAIVLSAKATASGSKSLIANYYNAADALGFPRSGQFWVTIGSEKLLVKNTVDGDNSGDTFTIIQRGYKGTSAASHAIGATITYGLQTDVYTGSVGIITQAYQKSDLEKVKKTKQVPNAPARNASGAGASTLSNGNVLLNVTRGTNGTNYNSMNRIWVNDPSGILKAGQKVKVHYKHINVSTYTVGNATTSGSGNHYSSVTRTSVTKANTGGKNGLGPEEAEIETVENAVAAKQSEYLVGKFANKYGDECGHKNIKTIRMQTDEKMGYSNTAVTVLKKGDILRINMNGSNNYVLPDGSKVNSTHSGDKNLYVRLTQDTALHPGSADGQGRYFCSLHIEPIVNGGDFNWNGAGGKKLWYIPDGARVFYAPKEQYGSTIKKVTFKETLAKGKWVGQQVHTGDQIEVSQADAAKPATGTGANKPVVGTHPQDYYVYNVHRTQVFNDQSFTVDFNGPATQLTNGTLGYMVGATFTAMNSAGSVNGGVFTTLRFTKAGVTSNQYAGYSITGEGIPVGTTVTSNTATSSGTFRITLSRSGNQVYDGTNYYTTGDFELFQPGSNVIAAGSTSIPVVPFTVNANYLKYSLVSLHYPTRAGENVMFVDPASSGTVDISTYPTGSWSQWNANTLSVSVNAGGTYGFAGFGQVVTGGMNSPYPLMNFYIDWYDEFGNLLKSSDGTDSLSGTVHSFNPSVTLGQSTDYGDSWVPNAIVAKAPLDQVLTSSATYASGTTTSGTYAIGGGGISIALAAGSYIYADRWAIVTEAASANAATLKVRFPYSAPPASGSTTQLTISATRAVPRIRITNANASDIYAISALMMKSLETPPYDGYYNLNTYLPELSVSTKKSTDISGASTFVIPATTDTSGADSLYLFDPTNDNNTREIHEGAGSPAIWTALSVSATAGSLSIILSSVLGLGVNGLLIVGKGSAIEEEVTIDPTWNGSNVVTLSSPLWYSHGAGSKVYAQTNQIVGAFNSIQSLGTPVAVFNWNNDGYVDTPSTSYTYKVEKTEDYGNTWQTLFNGDAVAADSTGVAAITDFEVIPNVLTYYRATPTFTTKNGKSVKGVPTAPLLAEVLNTDTWWLSSSSDETIRFPVLIQNGIQENQRHPAGVFYPLGSSRPIVTAGTVTGRDASVTIIWTDDANWKPFIAMLNRGETLVLTNPVESDRRYIFINSDVTYRHNAAKTPWREVNFSFVEVASPQGFGYTYGS